MQFGESEKASNDAEIMRRIEIDRAGQSERLGDMVIQLPENVPMKWNISQIGTHVWRTRPEVDCPEGIHHAKHRG